jgi:hypothetical protein
MGKERYFMENVQTQTTVAKATPSKDGKLLPELKFKARAFYDSFEDEKTKQKRQYLAIVFAPHPFDPGVKDVKLNFTSDKYKDENDKRRKDRVKSWFKYQVEKELRTSESVWLTGILQRRRFFVKDENKNLEYTAIFLDNPFEPGKRLHMYIRDVDAAAVLDKFCIDSLELIVEQLPEGTNLNSVS